MKYRARTSSGEQNRRGAPYCTQTRARLQLKLFPSQVEAPPDDPQVARVLLANVHLERTRQFGACWLGLELWRRLELDRFWEQTVDEHEADVPWSRLAAVLAINRPCAPGSELAIGERWYRSRGVANTLS